MKGALREGATVNARSAVFSVRAEDGAVQVEAMIKGPGAHSGRALRFPAVAPAEALQLARRIADCANCAAQAPLPLALPGAPAVTRKSSATALAEMRRLRAGGVKLKDIAARFNCSVGTVSRQTTGLLDPAENHAGRRPQNTLDAIVRLSAEGWTVQAIAERLGCSQSGVRAVLRRHVQGGRPARAVLAVVHQVPLALRPQLLPES